MIHLSRPFIDDEERQAVDRVLKSGMLASGPEVEAFEAEFAAFHEVSDAVAVTNGTYALQLGIWALGISNGDEVIVPSFTFAATAGVVAALGAKPVFADIEPKTFCLSAQTIEPLITPKTKAVITVHLYGQPASIDEVANLCESAGIALIEDAAQAHGAKWQGRSVGGFGAFGAFSFYPTKNMTTGEGGMITTNDGALAERLRLLRNHGMRHRYQHEIVGTNARMTDMAAAMGRVQLRRLAGWNEKRQSNALFYDEHLGRLGPAVETPFSHPDAEHVYHQYTIRCRNRDQITGALDDAGVGYGVYYGVPCHMQEAFAAVQHHTLPHSEQAGAEVLSIPVRPDLTRDELTEVVATIEGATRR